MSSTIAALVQDAATKFADAEAVVDPDSDGTARRVSFAELGELVRRAAAGCLARGVDPGHRVGIWAPNSLEWVVAALGVVSAGAALVPLNTRFKGDEASYILDKSRARLTFVAPPFLGNDYVAMLGGRDGVVTLDASLWDVDVPADVDDRIRA